MPISEATIRRVEQYTALFSAAAREHQVNRALLMGLCAAESDGQARSGAGTTGYKGLLQAGKDDAQLDPATSITAGAKKVKNFLTSLERLLGKLDIRFAAQSEAQRASQLICAFNAGPGVVVRALARAKAVGELLRWMEPQFYVPALVYYGSYSTRAHAKGFSEGDIEQAERWRTLVLKQQELTLADLADKTFQVDGSAQHVPALVVLSVEKKAADTGGYVAKVLRYATYFRSEEGVS